MRTMNVTRIAAAAIVLIGGAWFTAMPAYAAVPFYACTDAGWAALIADASAVCGSHASVVATCVGGKLAPQEIFCYE